MGANDAIHDEVAAKIAAHNAAILADLQKPRRRKAQVAGKRRRASKASIVGEQLLFGGSTTRVESFGQTRERVESINSHLYVPLPCVRQREVRCTDCDYRLVVRAERVICPKCGEIYGDAPTLRALRDAFGTIDFVGDGDSE